MTSHARFTTHPPFLARGLAVAALAPLLLLATPACSTTVDGADQGDSASVTDPLSSSYDECFVNDWYGDGTCDTGCAEPDPDCMTAECDAACAGVCDALWSGDSAPAVPSNCSADSCDCGEAPVECPDVCQAQCSGEPAPAVPDGCPAVPCDCAALTATDQVPPTLLQSGVPGGTPRCGMDEPDPATRAAVDATDAADAAAEASSGVAASSSKRTIPVVFHVIRYANPPDGHLSGNVPRKRLVRQIRVMNDAYAKTAFRFTLKKITRTTNNNWFYMDKGSRAEKRAKNALHAGGKGTLNVYTTGTLTYLGWGTFPWWNSGKQDGIVINYGTLPGGWQDHYDQGDTLVHEAGHWLGLYHTFQGGCSGGDKVGDTAAEASPAFGCPGGRDTCTGQAGNDPIRDYMDYTYDSCMNRFSTGQRRRMKRVTTRYR